MPDIDDEDRFTELRVRRKFALARDIWGFELEHPDGLALANYEPGAHVTVQTPSGARRQYSLCGSGRDTDCYTLGIKAERPGRGASLSLVERVCEGHCVPVSAPENTFLLEPADEYLFIAGGIGITPIMSMMRRLREDGHTGFQAVYCTRDRASTAFADELDEPFYRGRVVLHHDNGEPDAAYDLWPLFETPGRAQVYCCGPRPMMEEVRDMSGHWRSGSIHFEDFASDVEAVRPDDKAFTVRHADTGQVFHIPADATILETLRQGGCELRSSCESGTCSTCRLELVAGEADHRDMVLQPDERDRSIMICVSRARSPELVLRW